MEDLQGGALALEHRYEIGRPTGTIGFVSVYRGVQYPFARDVTILVFDALAEAGADEGLVGRIRASAEAYAALDHDGVVRAIDVGELDVNLPFVVVESARGVRLASHLDRVGTMSPEETAQLVDRLATVVEFGHEHGVVHGSLAPAWIHVDPDDVSTAEIEFWGLGLTVAEIRSMEDAYMSFDAVCALPPEMFSADAHATAASDVYALAAIAFRAMAGIHPFFDDVSDTSDGLLRMQREDAAPLTDYGVEREVADVVARGLERDPDARWETPRDFADAFVLAVRGEEEEAVAEELEDEPAEDLDESRYDEEPELWSGSEYDANIPSPRGGLLAVAVALLIISNAGWYLFNPLGASAGANPEVQTDVLPDGVHLFTEPAGAKVVEIRGEDENEIGETPLVIDPRIRSTNEMILRLDRRGFAPQKVRVRHSDAGNELVVELLADQ